MQRLELIFHPFRRRTSESGSQKGAHGLPRAKSCPARGVAQASWKAGSCRSTKLLARFARHRCWHRSTPTASRLTSASDERLINHLVVRRRGPDRRSRGRERVASRSTRNRTDGKGAAPDPPRTRRGETRSVDDARHWPDLVLAILWNLDALASLRADVRIQHARYQTAPATGRACVCRRARTSASPHVAGLVRTPCPARSAFHPGPLDDDSFDRGAAQRQDRYLSPRSTRGRFIPAAEVTGPCPPAASLSTFRLEALPTAAIVLPSTPSLSSGASSSSAAGSVSGLELDIASTPPTESYLDLHELDVSPEWSAWVKAVEPSLDSKAGPLESCAQHHDDESALAYLNWSAFHDASMTAAVTIAGDGPSDRA